MNLPVRRVTILFFGGVSEIEPRARDAARSYLVSVAGPLMSLLLSALRLPGAHRRRARTTPRATWSRSSRRLNGLVGAGQPAARAAARRRPRAARRGVAAHRLGGTRHPGRRPRRPVLAAWPSSWPALALATCPSLRRAAPVDLFMAALLGAYLWRGAAAELRQVRLRALLPDLDLRRWPAARSRSPATRRWPRRYDGPSAAGARALVIVDHDGQPEALVPEHGSRRRRPSASRGSPPVRSAAPSSPAWSSSPG